MVGNELAPFAVGRFIGVAEQLNDGDVIRHREQMLPGELHDGGELAPHGVECGNFKDTDTSATESRASLYAFHPMKDVTSVTMTLMGISMRVISDIVAFSCSETIGEGLSRVWRVSVGRLRREKEI